MIIRLRSRDGLERIELPEGSTLQALKQAIHAKLSIAMEGLHLSRQPQLLTVQDPKGFTDMVGDAKPLSALGVSHGDMVFMLVGEVRQVEPAYKKGLFEARQFGQHITVRDVIALQVRVERQEKPKVESVSFDRNTANVFQAYMQGAFKFGIKRGGLLYGNTDEAGNVAVDFIYEPPQEGTPETLKLHRGGDEEAMVEYLAGLLGYRKVGWLFAQSTKKAADYILNTEEVLQMAQMQAEIGDTCVTTLVSYEDNDNGGHVHFEAFQASEQCVQLAKDGWLQQAATPPGDGVTKMCNPKATHVALPVICAGKDMDCVDNDWFLCPVKIIDHEGKLSTEFPVENRLTAQGQAELKEHLRKQGGKSYVERISDFHLLLWLAKQPNLDANDMLLLCDVVRTQKPVLEGYRMLIDSIAGL